MSDAKLHSWIDGGPWQTGNGADQDLVSPWDGEPRGTVRGGGQAGADAAVAAASSAFRANRQATIAKRSEWLERAAVEVEGREGEIVAACIGDIGKPRRAATFEVRRTAAFMRGVARQVHGLAGEMIPLDSSPMGANRLGFAQRLPYGVVAAITPFNAPANLLMQKAAPALAVGNAIVIKPSPEGARVALILAECFGAAGLPKGLFNVVCGGVPEATVLAAHRGIALVTVTGGTAAGEALARVAGAKKFIGELGGNSPNIVLADANLADAAQRIAASAFEASGQQCISAQRVIVDASVYDTFLNLFIGEARKLKVGDPADQATDLGPVVHARAADRIMASIEESVASGARLLLGGTRHGCTIPPTVLADCPETCRVVQEEIFGPAAAVMRARDAEHALALANDCESGLQAALFTHDIDLAFDLAGRLETGSVWINEGSRFRLDNYPFGGVGRSGHGREGVRYALEEYTQWKFTGVRLA